MRATLVAGEPVLLDATALRRRVARAPVMPVAGDAGDMGTALHPAAVLVPLVAREEGFTVMLTRRTEQLRAHSGQIAFPGGRAEPHDTSPEATALRETEEEIGLAPSRVEPIGRLADYRTGSGFRITPVVALVTPPFALAPDADEVAEVFEVPLSFLLDPRRHERHSRQFEGGRREFHAIVWGDYYIWGATAGMLVSLYRQLAADPGQGA